MPARVARDAERVRDRVPPRAHQRDLARPARGARRSPRSRRGRRAGRSRPRSAGPTDGKNASRTSGSSTSAIMSASEAQRAAPAAPSSSRADLAPGGGAVGAVAHRVGGAQQRARPPRGRCRGRRAPRGRARRTAAPRSRSNGACGGSSGSSAPSSESVTRRRTRGRVERRARRRVEPVEVERGELLRDGRQDRVLGRVRALADRRRRELQRQRVAAHEAVDPLGLRLVEPGAAQHLGGVGGRERAERHRAQQLAERRAPDRARRVARGDHDARVRGQRRAGTSGAASRRAAAAARRCRS